MAVAVAGVPWLAAILGSMFGSLVAFFSKFLAKRVAILAAVIAAVVSLTVTFIVTIDGIMSGIYSAAPGMTAWGLILPSNFSTCLSAYVTARVARWVYIWQTQIIQWKLF